jgi:hypothetical protein
MLEFRSRSARRIFSIARFSICRTRSFEMPRRSPRDSSVAASSCSRRSRMILISRSDRTRRASRSQLTLRSLSIA